jgi:hypothetical protein
MGFFDGIGTFLSDGYDAVAGGLSDIGSSISSLWDETPTSSGSSFADLGASKFNEVNGIVPSSTPSFWDNVTKDFSQPSAWANIIKGGYSAYTASQAADKQDKLLEAQQQEKKDANELARLNILLQMEKEKYNLAAKGASGSGGGADRQIQMINALNQSANMRITALNNLSSGYIMATRGGR